MKDSLRERKKTATRLAIFNAANKLFTSKGYSKTTLYDIAEAADVSQRTIFSYFPSKEAIIFEKRRETINELFSHIENRKNQTVLESIRCFTTDEDTAEDAKLHALIDSNTELQEYLSQINTVVEKRLVELIASERNISINSIQAKLIAASCRAVIDYYMMNNQSDRAVSEIGVKYIEAGLNATT